MRLAVIGAGPIGLEAALGALERGFDVTVLEKDQVGASLRRWGSARLFSPFAMNVSARAKAALGPAGPPDDALLTGPEMADRVLEPLARLPALAGRVRVGHRVAAVGRARTIRRDLPGHPMRAERPFRAARGDGAGRAGGGGRRRARRLRRLRPAGRARRRRHPRAGRAGAQRRDHPAPRHAGVGAARASPAATCCSSATAIRPRTRWPCSRRRSRGRGSPGRCAARTAGRAWRSPTTRWPSAGA